MRLNHLFEVEDPDEEAPHFAALGRTGFYGERGAGCIFLAKDTGRILLGLRSSQVEQPHTYGSFGGAVNAHEDPRQGAEREAREETGFHGPLELVPLFVFHKNTFSYFNFVAVVPNEFTPNLNWENDGFKWCKFGRWPQPLHFGIISLIHDPASMQKLTQLGAH